MHGEHVPKDDVDEAEVSWKRTDKVTDDCWNLDGEVPDDGVPYDGRHQLVDQGAVVVALLEQDDAEQQRRRHQNSGRRKSDGERFGGRTFERFFEEKDIARKRERVRVIQSSMLQRDKFQKQVWNYAI